MKEEKKDTIINRDTLMPIGLVFMIFTAVWFLATLTSRVNYNSDIISAVSAEVDEKVNVNDFKEFKADLKADLSQDFKSMEQNIINKLNNSKL